MGVDPTDERSASDEDLLAAIGQGDGGALRTLYERHAPWLVVRLTRRCADPAVVEEVVQDTFLAVWRGARRYRGHGEVAAWIWGIGIRRLIDRLRRQRPVSVLADAMGGVEPSAEDRVLLGIEHGDLAGALERLSPELRAVLQATVLDGLTTREAGHLLGIPSGTVKTRLMRARRVLREELA
jgi:RNA polymerase sigma-70 factor, ECF subfamily